MTNYFKKFFGKKGEGQEAVKPVNAVEVAPHLYVPAKISFLETLTEEEIRRLKESMVATRLNYHEAIKIITKNQFTNPEYMVRQ